MEQAPLSFGQDLIYRSLRRADTVGTRPLPMSIGFVGELDVPALVAALRRVVADNDALRGCLTSLDPAGRQTVLPEPDDANLVALEQVLADSDEHFLRYASRSFDELIQDPYNPLEDYPFRFKLMRHTPTHHVLIGAFSHIFFDGHSLAMLPGRVLAAYRGEESEPLSFLEAARRQRERYGARAETRNAPFWRDRILSLPIWGQFGEPAPPVDAAGAAAVRFVALPSMAVQSMAGTQRVSPFQFVTWALLEALFELTAQDTIVLHLAVDTRDRADRATLGSFAHVLPAVFHRQAASLRDVQQVVLEAVFHRHVPGEVIQDAYAELAAAWSVPRRATIMVSEQELRYGTVTKARDASDEAEALVVQSNPVKPTLGYVADGINLVVSSFTDHLAIVVAYHPGIFTEEMMSRIMSTIERRVALADQPEEAPGPIPPMTMPEGFVTVGPPNTRLLWVDPEQTAWALRQHPQVLDAAVTAVEGPDGAFLRASVVARPGVTETQLREHVATLAAGRHFLVPPQQLKVDYTDANSGGSQ